MAIAMDVPDFNGKYEYGGVKAAAPNSFDDEVRARAAAQRAARATSAPVEGGTTTPNTELNSATKPNLFQRIKAVLTPGAGGTTAGRVFGGVGRAGGVAQAGMGVADMVKDGVTVDNVTNTGLGVLTAVNPALGLAGSAIKFGVDTAAGMYARYKVPERNPNIYTPALEQMVKNEAAGAPVNANVPLPVAEQEAVKQAAAAKTAATEKSALEAQRAHELALANAPARAAAEAAERVRLERQYAPTVYRDEQPAVPRLGTTGGVFTALTNFAGDVGRAGIQSAAENRDFKAGIASGTLGVAGAKARTEAAYKGAQIGIDQQKANAETVKAGAAVVTANAKAKDATKVVQDPAGNPIIVDTGKNTQRVPTKIPSEDEFVTKAKEDPRNKGATEQQIREHYRKTYGT